MLISGPSGSGKTEVWRVIKRLYGDLFPIKIINGARITEEGWKGDMKLIDQIDERLINGGILIVDEFDKLAGPRHNAIGENVAAALQSEFLKLLEGEENITSKSHKNKSVTMAEATNDKTTKQLGLVLVGAFESMRNEDVKIAIGFGNQMPSPQSQVRTDSDYIDFGLLPELVGRIATKCETKTLSDGDYIRIIKSPHSRVSNLLLVLNIYNKDFNSIIHDDELQEMIAISKANKTGVRWVASMVENKILSKLHKTGIGGEQDDQCSKPQRDDFYF